MLYAEKLYKSALLVPLLELLLLLEHYINSHPNFEKLELKINFEKRLRGDYYLLGNINEKTFSFCLNNTNEIVLTELSAGVLNLKLTVVHSGQVFREWRIEPLIIKQLDDGNQFACEQTLTNFNRRLSTCEKAILELTNLIKNKGGLL